MNTGKIIKNKLKLREGIPRYVMFLRATTVK